MAQSNFTPIQLYRTTTAAAIPTAGNLAAGELAINLTDEKLYFKNAAGTVKLLASNSGSLGSVTSVDVSGGTTGLTTSGGPITSSGTITLAGTLGVANGGTGTATAFTAGSVVFAGASGVYTQDNANLFWDNANDRLGIGTATPLARLNVEGENILLRGGFMDFGPTAGANGAGRISSALGGGGVSGSLIFSTLNSSASMVEAMRIDSSGNVGIGTSSPTDKLVLNTASNVQVATKYINSNTTGVTIGAAADGSAFVYQAAAQPFIVYTNAAERMRITSAGDVGIGISTPGAKLEVTGSVRIYQSTGGVFNMQYTTANAASRSWQINHDVQVYGDFAIQQSTTQTGNTYADRLYIDASGNVGIGETTPGAALQVNGNIRVSNGTGFTSANSLIRSIQAMSGSTNQFVSSSIDFYTAAFTDNGQIAFSTGATERMRVDGSGNVGIGTSSPIGKMEVVQNSGTGNVITVRNTNSNQFFIGGLSMLNAATANNFGVTIGTGVRDVDGTDSFFTINKVTSGTSYVSELAYYDLSAEFWKFSTNNTERMRITSAGNVGIGTTGPAYLLDVAASGSSGGIVDVGRFYASAAGAATSRILFGSPANEVCAAIGAQTTTATSGDLTFYTEAGGSLNENMRLNASGNLGIGTTAPGAKLEVVGTARVRQPDATRYRSDWYVESGNAYMNGFDDTAGLYIPVAFNFSSYTFNSSAAERMRIDSSGNLLVGATAIPSSSVAGIALKADLANNASTWSCGTKTAASTMIEFVNGNGQVGTIITSGTATAYNTSSDYRLKEIDGPIANSGTYIDALKPVQGSWKSDGSRFIGLLAHEVQEVSETPIATGEKDGEKMQAMDYSAPELIANLIAELQSLRARVAQLEGN
jgi:hypothetical protein